ncbi:hypothetical protein L9G15_23720, partial [Shewanella sp. A3A]|nr:hypothetical protein [Shewanella ferrihydritica]
GGGTQTNQVQGGEFWLGTSGAAGASLTMTGSSMTGTSWFVMSRGNSTTNLLSTLEATNSTLTFANATFGYASTLTGYTSTSEVKLTDST